MEKISTQKYPNNDVKVIMVLQSNASVSLAAGPARLLPPTSAYAKPGSILDNQRFISG
jgi:hypothetical protein